MPTEGRPSEELEISTDPADYELFIDNDSGTYRPNGHYLPLLKQFISKSFPELNITTLDCTEDAEQMATLKGEQREFKREGGQMTFLQKSSTSSLSISSSDEEDLDERSGTVRKKRGELSQRVHDMRDVKGQFMKWAQAENHETANGPGYSSSTPRAPVADSCPSKPAEELTTDQSALGTTHP